MSTYMIQLFSGNVNVLVGVFRKISRMPFGWQTSCSAAPYLSAFRARLPTRWEPRPPH